jgi:hypothetical protein
MRASFILIKKNKYKGYFKNRIPYVDINAILYFICKTEVKV